MVASVFKMSMRARTEMIWPEACLCRRDRSKSTLGNVPDRRWPLGELSVKKETWQVEERQRRARGRKNSWCDSRNRC
jgi:hypothetical protein